MDCYSAGCQNHLETHSTVQRGELVRYNTVGLESHLSCITDNSGRPIRTYGLTALTWETNRGSFLNLVVLRNTGFFTVITAVMFVYRYW